MGPFFVRHSRCINIAVNVLLVVLCSISYAILPVLYSTQGMRTESFMFVDRGNLPPTTAIPLLGVLLTGATSALLTRSVEHSVWIPLLFEKTNLLPTKGFSIDEFHQRAQWSVSPFARLLYAFKGHSWLLRISGILLFGTAILNPILLYGVRPETSRGETIATIEQSEPWFSGFTPSFDKEIGQDNQMMLASLVSMNNLNAPAARVCNDASCSVVTRATALHAECIAFDLPRPSSAQPNATLCSSYGNTTCLSKEQTGLNFTTGPMTECDPRGRAGECLISDFAVILGIWSSYNLENLDYRAHAVDCQIHKGSVEIKQTGTGTPVLRRETFIKSTTRTEISSDEWYWQAAYRWPTIRVNSAVKPYHFESERAS